MITEESPCTDALCQTFSFVVSVVVVPDVFLCCVGCCCARCFPLLCQVLLSQMFSFVVSVVVVPDVFLCCVRCCCVGCCWARCFPLLCRMFSFVVSDLLCQMFSFVVSDVVVSDVRNVTTREMVIGTQGSTFPLSFSCKVCLCSAVLWHTA